MYQPRPLHQTTHPDATVRQARLSKPSSSKAVNLTVRCPARISVNRPARIFLTDDRDATERDAEYQPFGLASIQEVLRVLISLLNPHDQQHTDTMRLMALGLLNIAFEVAGESMGRFASLRIMVADHLCKHLFQVRNQSVKLGSNGVCSHYCGTARALRPHAAAGGVPPRDHQHLRYHASSSQAPAGTLPFFLARPTGSPRVWVSAQSQEGRTRDATRPFHMGSGSRRPERARLDADRGLSPRPRPGSPRRRVGDTRAHARNLVTLCSRQARCDGPLGQLRLQRRRGGCSRALGEVPEPSKACAYSRALESLIDDRFTRRGSLRRNRLLGRLCKTRLSSCASTRSSMSSPTWLREQTR
jgi:hypothetical protein